LSNEQSEGVGVSRLRKRVVFERLLARLQALAPDELLLDAAAYEMDDLFTFTVQRAAADDDLAGGGQRWTVRAELAGRDVERVAIDIGFGKPPVVAPDTIVSRNCWSCRNRADSRARARCRAAPRRGRTPVERGRLKRDLV
jgi:hypothetical protein